MTSSTPSPINADTLRQFTEQLSHWAESLISRGRSPLRKVETFPSLLTAQGEQHPPLLFWINRDSCMAGGVVLFPSENDASALDTGHYCAQALGLRYFVTWTRSEISFWDDTEPPTLRKQIPLAGGGQANTRDFQEALQLLLEEIKLLAVLAAVPPPELSPCYLANLWRTTLLAAEPLLNEHYRIARSEGRLAYGDSPQSLAIGKAYLTFIRLLALSQHDLLSSEIQPHLLEAEIDRALPSLPPGLRRSLAIKDKELPLPETVAVRYHLLFRRLTQLRPASDVNRCYQALALLLTHEHGRLGGHPPPFPVPAARSTLLLNPDQHYATGKPALELASAPLLAALALQRDLGGHPAIDQTVSLWEGPENFLPCHVSGTLADHRLPSKEQRSQFLALLRRSWPNRRFRFPAATPTWIWQLLHLLGLAADGATIELRLPNGWLNNHYGLPVLELIQKEFVLDHLGDEDDGWLSLRLHKTTDDDRLTTLSHHGNPRTFEWRWLHSGHPALVTLALYLPEPLLELLENDRLRLSTESNWPSCYNEAIFSYSRSTLGQTLWQLLGKDRPLPRRAQLQKEMLRVGMPLPPLKVLDQLQQAMAGTDTDSARQRACDKELSYWLGNDLAAVVSGLKSEEAASAIPLPEANDPADLAEKIVREVFVDGLPIFPDHYLYDYYRPELRNFQFTPPLSRGTEFFGRVELIDRKERKLEVENLDSARALLLCAAAGNSAASLPVDEQITAAIVHRYLADLQNLHQTLSRSCHRHCNDPQRAEALIDRLWSCQPLPAWQTVVELSHS